MKFLILGMGRTGEAVREFLWRRGIAFTAVDLVVREGVLSDQDPIDLSQFSTVVVSPGVAPSHSMYREAKKREIEVIGETELACRYLSHRMVGITGTNGKTTVTLLVTHVLNHSGRAARAVGNIGVPLITAADSSSTDILVVELSSWQLETMKSKTFDIAIVLNISPDHLDRHGTIEEYAKAKLSIGGCLKEGAPWWIQNFVIKRFSHLLLRPYRGYEAKRAELENRVAAQKICSHFGVSHQEFCLAMQTFTPPPHRNQLVRLFKGVSYFNDSKATNVDAVIKAVQSSPMSCILIAGGRDKGASFVSWIDLCREIKMICTIGEAADKIKEELSLYIPIKKCLSLNEAVNYASSIAVEGDRVLLSPGCSSLDMFTDYIHRGEEFVKCVHAL